MKTIQAKPHLFTMEFPVQLLRTCGNSFNMTGNLNQLNAKKAQIITSAVNMVHWKLVVMKFANNSLLKSGFGAPMDQMQT